MPCPIEKKCPKEICVYPPTDPMFLKNIRELYEYCPVVDMYFNEEIQEAYELSKIPISKRRKKKKKGRKR